MKIQWSVWLAAWLLLVGVGRGLVRADEMSDVQRQAVQTDVSSIRNLPALSEVAIQRVSQAELRAHFLEELNDQESIDALATAKKYNVLLGLVQPDIDLHQTLVDTLSGAVIGQYRATEKTMYLVAEADASVGPETKTVIAHEYTHALQDQHFGIENLTSKVKDHDDRSLAIRALVEGDASITELLYEREKLSSQEAAELRRQRTQAPNSLLSVPFILQEELKFPYVEGLYFIVDLWQRGGFEEVNAAYLNPPVSTEQVLHPDKYFSKDEPIELGLPDLLPVFGADWRQTYANVMGELELRILIEQFTDSSTAARAAAGWGGDAFTVLEGPGSHVAWIMDSAWDTEMDAREFAETFGFSLERRFGTARVSLVEEPGRTLWSTPVGIVGVTRSAARVAVVYAPERAQSEAVLQALAPDSSVPRLPVATPKPAP
ncbi:MAG: hypothetical protein ACKVVP_02295 [Chloroflexota bacterium]